MTDKVHNITDVKKSHKIKLPTLKQVGKYAALTVFGTAVALVAYDKVTHGRADSDTSENETTGS